MEVNKSIPQQPRIGGPQGGGPAPAVNTVLARLINLSTTAMNADSQEKAANIIVNQVHVLVKTERAMLIPLTGTKRVFCVSGDLKPSEDNPFAEGVQEIRKAFRDQEDPKILTKSSMNDIKAPRAEKIFDAMGGTTVLWIPLPTKDPGAPRFALWLERWGNKSWSEEEIRLISHAKVFFGHSLYRRAKKKQALKRKKKFRYIVLLVLFLLMWLPVHSRVTAPAQVVPDHPYYVFAPFDGIVEDLAVKPGEKVEKGDLIYRYDTRVLEKQLEEALRGGLAVARAELARLEGAAYADQEARAKIPVQKLEVERKQAEVAFLKKQLELSEVRTDADGVVVLDDPDALIGAFLQTGQMVLSVADPKRTKLRVMAPVSDAGLIQDGAPVNVRLDSDPLKTMDGHVNRVGFDVRMSDERVPSVLVEAVWDGTNHSMPGQRGSARIQGPLVPLGIQLFRKPLMSLRTMLGI